MIYFNDPLWEIVKQLQQMMVLLLDFGVLSNNTPTCGQEEWGVKPLTLRFIDYWSTN